MAQNTNSWWKSWLKLSNLIALATLAATIWGGFTFLSNKQEVEAKNGCEVRGVAQKTGDKPNLGQSVKCSDDSVIEGVTQE